MANFSKSFNFRNGVQVDNDKFIVKPTTGLVGIGITQPTEVLDVVGNIQATGITSARDIFAGAGITVGYANSNRIMLDIDPLTGVSSITAQRFYGDGSNMSGIFAISVAGFVANSTNGGILTSFRKVGIGVTTPTDRFNVEGDSKFTGITTFVGVSTVSGDLFSTNLGVSGNSNLKGNLNVGSANVTGVSTFTGTSTFVGITTNTSTLFANQLSVAGVSTLRRTTIDVDGSLTSYGSATFGESGGTRGNNKNFSIIGDNRQFLVSRANDAILFHINDNNGQAQSYFGTNLQVAGISTFSSTINVGNPTGTGGAGIGVTITDFGGSGQASFSGIVTAGQLNVDGHTELDNVNVSGVLSATSLSQLNVTGVSTLTGRVNANEINSATGNGFKLLHDGTQILNTIGAGVSVFNKVTVGSLNGGTSGLSTHTGEVSYGVETGLTLYSRRRSLNVANFDSGNLNYYLNASNITFDGADLTGNFNWLKGTNNAPIMTLTGIGGSLGIGVSNPSKKLEVIGTSRFTDKMILNNVDVGDTPVAKILQSASTSQNISGIFSGSHYGNIIDEKGFTILSKGTGVGNTEFTDTFFSGNVHTNAGISTMSRLRIGDTDNTSGTLSVRAPALEEPSGPSSPIFMVGTKETPASQDMRFQVKKNGQVGIKTSVNSYSEIVGIDANNTSAVIGMLAVGFGATDPVTSGFGLDLTYAGRSVKSRQMVLPKVNTTERDAFEENTVGAVIYNTQIQKIQVYTGSSWETVSSS